MQTVNHIENILKTLPDKPGVYQYFDKDNIIIYVGKAKSLKKRVLSYFNKDNFENNKLSILVKKICDIKYIVVESEQDAFLLENNLIKKYQPRYNVKLKDDKTYPWICIKNEAYPRVMYTRHLVRDGSKYFGPYTNQKVLRTLLDLIKQLYPLRTCNLNLSEELIEKKKYKVCLEFHLGNCLAPCVGKQTATSYNESIDFVKLILKGNITSVIEELKRMMFDYAETMEFEKAQIIKEKIETLDAYKSKSVVVSPTIHNVDVFSIVTDAEAGYVNYLKVVNGSILQAFTIELKKRLDESPQYLLELAIIDLRARFESSSEEIILPFEVDLSLNKVEYTVPQRGDKKALLDLSLRNVKYYILDKNRQLELVDPDRHAKRILAKMKEDLRMLEIPDYIECFDNSNIQGSFPVAAMVVFRHAKPSKKEYRHFNIKTVEGPNDFASMEEVVFRRYKRLIEEEQPLPQLIIVDGGKGQLSSALLSLDKLGLRGKISIIGIAKKLEEIYYPGDSLPMYLDKKSETLKVIQQMRDEAHRFGITHHRKRRDKDTIKTELTVIIGIGDVIAQKLLKQFKSVKAIKEASFEDIKSVVSESKAKLIFSYFNP